MNLRIIILSILVTSSLFFSCKSSLHTVEINEDKNNIQSYRNLLPDTYSNGFEVGMTKEGDPALHGTLDLGGTATGTKFWRLAQWNCYNNDMMKAQYKFENDKHEYFISPVGNQFVVDTKNNILVLECISSTEYGKNGITSNPRKNYESWPHLLIEHNWTDNNCLRISDKQEIRMCVDYTILKVEDKIPVGKKDKSLHAAQFQWYITAQNRNELSEDYGRYIWFGLSFYDNRYEFTPFYAAQDGGKEHNTGAFIYTPDMQQILGVEGKTEIGKKVSVNVDILPLIKEAFTLAQQRNYLSQTKWKDLYIGHTNIGWEVPGTYDVAVEISKLNILYR